MVQKAVAFRDHPLAYQLAFSLVLGVVLLVLMPPQIWSVNEDVFLTSALRKFQPDRFEPYAALFDPTLSRIGPDYFVGFLIDRIGYDAAHFALRFSMAFIYAFALAYFFITMQLPLLWSVAVICFFGLRGENILGGEWLFRGVETKTWAYALVIIAIASAAKLRWLRATVLCLIATYCHFLVGGFWAAAILATLFVSQPVRAAQFGAGYFLAVSPILFVLLREQSAATLSTDGLTSDYIYSILRNPHHVAPFGPKQWGVRGLIRLLWMIAASVPMLWLAASRPARYVIALSAGVAAYLVLALLVSYLDREAGMLGKFYLFRPSSLALLLFWTGVALILRQYVGRVPYVWIPLALFIAYFAAQFVLKDQKVEGDQHLVEQRLDAVVNRLNKSTLPNDIVLFDPSLDEKYVAVLRKLTRPTLVTRKAIPTTPSAIQEWYKRTKFREHIFQNGCVGELAYPVKYLVALRPAPAALSTCGVREDVGDFSVFVRDVPFNQRTPLNAN